MTSPTDDPNGIPATLARVDERTKRIVDDIAELNRTTIKRAEFMPVRNVVYGLVALILTGVTLAIINIVLVQGSG